jgi:hypothetical protein
MIDDPFEMKKPRRLARLPDNSAHAGKADQKGRPYPQALRK